jgi:nitrogen fixation protein FixH
VTDTSKVVVPVERLGAQQPVRAAPRTTTARMRRTADEAEERTLLLRDMGRFYRQDVREVRRWRAAVTAKKGLGR